MESNKGFFRGSYETYENTHLRDMLIQLASPTIIQPSTKKKNLPLFLPESWLGENGGPSNRYLSTNTAIFLPWLHD